MAIIIGFFVNAITSVGIVWNYWYVRNPVFDDLDQRESYEFGMMARDEAVGMTTLRIGLISIRRTGGLGTGTGTPYDTEPLRSSELVPDWLQPIDRYIVDGASVTAREFGWPFRSFRTLSFRETLLEPGLPRIVHEQSTVDLPWFSDPQGNPLRLPVPKVWLWQGIVLNSLFYALILLGIPVLWSRTKRLIRKRRGRCPRCAYNLAGDLTPGCPECGWNRREASPTPPA